MPTSAAPTAAAPASSRPRGRGGPSSLSLTPGTLPGRHWLTAVSDAPGDEALEGRAGSVERWGCRPGDHRCLGPSPRPGEVSVSTLRPRRLSTPAVGHSSRTAPYSHLAGRS